MTKLETIARISEPAWWRFWDAISPRYQSLDPVQAAREKQIAKAREVVEALREPTEAMVRTWDDNDGSPEDAWEHGIDAILDESEETKP